MNYPPDSLEYIYGIIWDNVKEGTEKSLIRARHLLHGLCLGFRYAGFEELEADAGFLWDLLNEQQDVYLNEDSSQ
jgi:hypothetical protein